VAYALSDEIKIIDLGRLEGHWQLVRSANLATAELFVELVNGYSCCWYYITFIQIMVFLPFLFSS